MAQGLVTEEMIEQARSKIGLKLRIEHSISNEKTARLARRGLLMEYLTPATSA